MAIRHFDRELALTDRRKLYGPEYAGASCVGRGHAELALGAPDRALASFRAAREYLDGHAPAALGEAVVFEHLGRLDQAADAWAEVDDAVAHLERTKRVPDALYLRACRAALSGRPAFHSVARRQSTIGGHCSRGDRASRSLV